MLECLHRRACTPAHLKLPNLNYSRVAEGGRPELWKERSLGSREKKRGTAVRKDRGSVKVAAERKDFESYVAEIQSCLA